MLYTAAMVTMLASCTKEVEVEKIVYVEDTEQIEALRMQVAELMADVAEAQANVQTVYITEVVTNTIEVPVIEYVTEVVTQTVEVPTVVYVTETVTETVYITEVVTEIVEVPVEIIVTQVVTETIIVDNTDTTQIAELQAQLDAANATIIALQADLVNFENIQGLNVQLQGQLDTANATIATLQAQLDAANAAAAEATGINIEGATIVETPTGRGGNWFAVEGGWIQRYSNPSGVWFQAWLSLDPLTPVGSRERTAAEAAAHLGN